jgi:hypothetical protein
MSDEISKIIKDSSSTKMPGADQVTNLMLKQLSPK